MTAAELIALLKSHPKACIVLRMKFHNCKTLGWTCWATPKGQSIWFSEATKEKGLTNILNWLTGAAANEFVRRGWYLPNPAPVGGWVVVTPALIAQGNSLLHALLAAIEAAEETTT
jgi:hypothetical protein